MVKTIPSKVAIILKEGKNTYKPEMKKAVKMQNSVIVNLISPKYKNISLKQLFVIAQEKQNKAKEKRYKETCNYLENALKNYNGEED